MIRIAPLVLLICAVALAAPAEAAGSGAGAGGSGRQRAINSGLPAGDPGPPGSVNNPHQAARPAASAPKASGPEKDPSATNPR